MMDLEDRKRLLKLSAKDIVKRQSGHRGFDIIIMYQMNIRAIRCTMNAAIQATNIV